MDRIRVLPDNIANQIAAGEVVGRPASVVKELMENAVDAGATSVTVSFSDGGKAVIKVADNGGGMSSNDLRLAFERHATSKITGAEDLFNIRSFGFRGEALPSICSVSELEAVSRQKDSELATRVVINGGTFSSAEPSQAPQGTRITVRNLFYNTPARRRFLKDSTIEARHIVSEFQRVALCHPETAFTLINNDVTVYQLPPSNLRQRIVGIHGKNISGNLLEVSADTSIMKLEGFVGQPSAAKKTNREQYLFVNGRYFRSPYFHKAVMQAYQKLVAADTQPSYFLYLTIDPDRVDVNVHPQKTEVKFEDEQAMWQIFNAATKEALGRSGMIPMMDFEIDSSLDIPVYREREFIREPRSNINPGFNPFDYDDLLNERASSGFSAADPVVCFDRSVMDFISGAEDAENETIFFSGGGAAELDRQTELELELELESGSVLPGEVVRINQRYCAFVMGGTLMVANIQRAWLTVIYHRYMRMAGNSTAISQQLLFPERLELPAEDYHNLEKSSEELSSLGYEIVFMDDNIIEVTAAPPELSSGAIGDALTEISDFIANHGETASTSRTEGLSLITARRISLTADKLSGQPLLPLIEELVECGNFTFTPAGQRILMAVTPAEIESRLK